MGIMVKVLTISLCSENSTFAPSSWFMHAWSHTTHELLSIETMSVLCMIISWVYTVLDHCIWWGYVKIVGEHLLLSARNVQLAL